ncbi:MAG: hypothetical protein ACREP6_04930 [Candidatus Binataceae bacterium]
MWLHRLRSGGSISHPSAILIWGGEGFRSVDLNFNNLTALLSQKGADMKGMKVFVIAGLLIATTLAFMPQAWAQTRGTPEKHRMAISALLDSAHSSSDHEELAKLYTRESETAAATAKEFRQETDAYNKKAAENQSKGSSHPLKQAAAWARKERNQYLAISKEDHELAQMHTNIANELKKSGK